MHSNDGGGEDEDQEEEEGEDEDEDEDEDKERKAGTWQCSPALGKARTCKASVGIMWRNRKGSHSS